MLNIKKFKYVLIVCLVIFFSLCTAFLCVNIAKANNDAGNWENFDNAVCSNSSQDLNSSDTTTNELYADCGVVIDFRKSCWWKQLNDNDVEVVIENDDAPGIDEGDCDLEMYTNMTFENEFHFEMYYDGEYNDYYWGHDQSAISIKSIDRVPDASGEFGDNIKLTVFVGTHKNSNGHTINKHNYVILIKPKCSNIEYSDTPFRTFIPYWTKSINVPVEKSRWGDEYFVNFNIENSDFGDVTIGDEVVDNNSLLVVPADSTILYHKDNSCSSYIEFQNVGWDWHSINSIHISSPSIDSVKINNDNLSIDNQIYIYEDFTFNITFGKTHLTLTNENPEFGAVFYDDIELNDFDGFIHKMQFDYQIQDLDKWSKKIMVSYKCPDVKNKTIICQANETCYVNKIVINRNEENHGTIKDDNIDIKVYYSMSSTTSTLNCKNIDPDFGNVYYGDNLIDNTSFKIHSKAQDYRIIRSESDTRKIIINFDYAKDIEVFVVPVEGGSIKDVNVHIAPSVQDDNILVYINVSFNWTQFDFKNNNPEYGHITYNDQNIDNETFDFSGKVKNYNKLPGEGSSVKIVFNFDNDSKKEVIVTPIEGGSINNLQVNFPFAPEEDVCTKIVVAVTFSYSTTHVDFVNRNPEYGNIIYNDEYLDNENFITPGKISKYEIKFIDYCTRQIIFYFEEGYSKVIKVEPKNGCNITDLMVNNTTNIEGWILDNDVNVEVGFDNKLTKINFRNKTPDFADFVFEGQHVDNSEVYVVGKPLSYKMPYSETQNKQIIIDFDYADDRVIEVVPSAGGVIDELTVNNSSAGYGELSGQEITIELTIKKTSLALINPTPNFGSIIYDGNVYDKYITDIFGEAKHYYITSSINNSKKLTIEREGYEDVEILFVPNENNQVYELTVNNSTDESGDITSGQVFIMVYFGSNALDSSENQDNFVNLHYYGFCEEQPNLEFDVDDLEGSQIYKSCNYVIRQNCTCQRICYTISFYAPDVDVQNASASRRAVPIAQREIRPADIMGDKGMDCLGFTADAGCFSPYMNKDGETCSYDSEANAIGTVTGCGNIHLKFGKISFASEKNTVANRVFNLSTDKQDTHKSNDKDIEYELKKIGSRSLIVQK